MKKVSIIVPAYNAHNTLARCLGSLVNQTLDDIEIIVTDDASQDDTLQIMKRCEELYPGKVIAIEGKVNRKSGGARNQALELASGEYIGFVDSDDYVTSNTYELLYNRAIEMNADIVDSGYYSEALDKAILLTSDDMIGDIDDEKRRKLILSGGYLCTKIYKRELFFNPPIRFRENVLCLEDNEIIRYMFFIAKNVYTVKAVLYYYSDSPGSATKVIDTNLYFDSVYGVMEALYQICHEHPLYKEKTKQAIESALSVWYSYCINRCLFEHIKKHGAGVDMIPRYFDEANAEETAMIKKVAKLRGKIISGNFRDNPDVMKKLSEIDLKIMEECDRRFLRTACILNL